MNSYFAHSARFVRHFFFLFSNLLLFIFYMFYSEYKYRIYKYMNFVHVINVEIKINLIQINNEFAMFIFLHKPIK